MSNADIQGTDTGSVTEDGTQAATGTLTVSDPQGMTEESFTVQTGVSGTYGTLDIDPPGNWTYTLNNNPPSVRGLNPADHVTDTITVESFDGTPHAIVITVNGADEPMITPPN